MTIGVYWVTNLNELYDYIGYMVYGLYGYFTYGQYGYRLQTIWLRVNETTCYGFYGFEFLVLEFHLGFVFGFFNV